MKNQEWITIPQLARKMGFSRIAVYNRVKKGRIPARKIGRDYVISVRDLPYILGEKLSERDKQRINQVVQKAVQQYGMVFKWLSRQ